MEKEIERKFIVTDHMGWYNFINKDTNKEEKLNFFEIHQELSKKTILQIYVSYVPEIRYRMVIKHKNSPLEKKDAISYIKTEKSGEGLVREEKEYEVTANEFFLALQDAKGFLVKERMERSSIPGVSLDIYDDGLKVLEMEFDSEDEANAFEPEKDHFFSQLYLTEVTGDKTYSNSNLAKNVYSYTTSKKLLLLLLEEFEKNSGLKDFPVYACSLSVNKDSFATISRNILAQKVFLSQERGSYLYINKATKKGVPGKQEINFYGVNNTPLYVSLTEEQSVNVYKRLKEKELKLIDEHIKRVQLFKTEFSHAPA